MKDLRLSPNKCLEKVILYQVFRETERVVLMYSGTNDLLFVCSFCFLLLNSVTAVVDVLSLVQMKLSDFGLEC